MPSSLAAPSTRRYTWRDFVALGEDDRRELVDGALVEVEVPTKWHENVVSLLVFFLTGWARTRGCRVLASAYKIRVDEHRGVAPDVQVMTEATYRQAGAQGLASGAPQLVVEVVSPGSRSHDRVRKLAWYASIGVPEYWLVDPLERSFERLLLKSDGHYSIAEAVTSAVFRPASMPGLEIPLTELWDAARDAPSAAEKPVRRRASRKR